MDEHLTLADRLRAFSGSPEADTLPFVDGDDLERAANAVAATEGVSDEALRALASRGGLAALLEAARPFSRVDKGDYDPVCDGPVHDDLQAGYLSIDATIGDIRRLRKLMRALLPQTGEGAATDHANVEPVSAEDAWMLAQAKKSEAEVATWPDYKVAPAYRPTTPAPMSDAERGALSKLEICNLALRRVGVPEISSLDENSSAARHCLELYAPTLDNLLRCGTWPYQPLLANALSWRLAADLASELRNDVTRRHEAMGEFSRALLANQEAGFAEKAINAALSKREDR
ncbi:MAG: hypothetical protein ACTS10_21825 [Kiloniellales bacterium]